MASLDSVLIVDDEPAVRELMSRWVTSLGLAHRTAANADEALATIKSQHYDLAVIDMMMPGRDGLWLAHEVQRTHPDTAVVLATAYSQLLGGDASQHPIAADLLIKPFQRDRFAQAVDRGREWRTRIIDEGQLHARLSAEVDERTAQICERLGKCAESEDEADALLAVAMDRVPDVVAHSERVARYARAVAREMRLSIEQEELITLAGRFHDIGKAAMPDAILGKAAPLTAEEAIIMRRHVTAGAEILEAASSLAVLAPLVVATHEWFSGDGYPNNLAGTDIPLGSRIVTVVDAYDVMTHDRVYRLRVDATEAIAELKFCRTVQFDPDVVTAFLAVLGRH